MKQSSFLRDAALVVAVTLALLLGLAATGGLIKAAGNGDLRLPSFTLIIR